MVGVMTFTCLDAFGLGALLAWYVTFRPENLDHVYTAVKILAFVAFLFFVLSLYEDGYNYLPVRTINSFMALFVIAYIVLNQREGVLQKNYLLHNKVLLFLGKLSYGLYLYHHVIPRVNTLVSKKFIDPFLPSLFSKEYGYPCLLWKTP